jgi:hypothetical protein
MNASSFLTKYRVIIAGLLGVQPSSIKFSTLYQGTFTEFSDELLYEKPDSDFNLGWYRVTIESPGALSKTVASFKLYQMPHCCAIAVSCEAYVYPEFRNKKIGTTMNKFRQELCKLLGYSVLMCTDIEQNTHQRKLLKTNGWKDIHDIVNSRTHNRVFISVKNL